VIWGRLICLLLICSDIQMLLHGKRVREEMDGGKEGGRKGGKLNQIVYHQNLDQCF